MTDPASKSFNPEPQVSSPTGLGLMEMYDRLFDHFGPQHWWPAESPLEVMVGAVLTQNTNWKNAERAVIRLKDHQLLDVARLDALPVRELAEKIRPAGYYNIKAGRLKHLIRFVMDRYEGDLSGLGQTPKDELRQELLSVKGIGPETADSIILYAAGLPVFVVDRYTHRILHRHDMIDEEIGYEALQELFMDHLPADADLYNEFHALIVTAGKAYCRKRPDCTRCPLNGWPS